MAQHLTYYGLLPGTLDSTSAATAANTDASLKAIPSNISGAAKAVVERALSMGSVDLTNLFPGESSRNHSGDTFYIASRTAASASSSATS